MNKLVFSLLIIGLISCKNKKYDSTKAYFSVTDYLSSQVKHMDSLQFNFTKIVSVDTTSDSSKISKEEFHRYAEEFLNLPDIASSERMDDYKETNDFDETLNNVLLIYTPKSQDQEVQNETVMMEPDDMGNTHVKTILVHTIQNEKDSSIEKNMTWHIDKRFQIVTKVNKPNQPEKITTVVVKWE